MQDDIKLKLEKRRWLVLASFSLFTFVNASAFVTYSPILDVAAKFYQVDKTAIIWFSNIWYIVYVIGSIPAIFLLRINLGYSIIGASILNAIGSWIRYVAFANY